MLKVIVPQPHPESMSREDFRRHLREVHLPLVRRIPGVRRVVMNWVIPSPDDPPPDYEGVAEAWYDDMAAMQAAYATPEGQAVIADAPNYLDMNRFQLLVVEEEVPLSPA